MFAKKIRTLKSYYKYIDDKIKNGVRFNAANGEVKNQNRKEYQKKYYEEHKQELKLKRILKGDKK